MKRIKILFVLLLMMSFSFKNIYYAAIVSDDDGNVFITKAEFDVLKSDFNKQIDNYNDSIHNKIEGAITSYLAGLVLGGEYSLEICNTKIGYPLTLRMLGGYNGNNVRNIGTLDTGTKLWTDDYEILVYGTITHVEFYSWNNMKKNPANTIKNFYNGKVVSGKYIIDSMYNNYNVKAFMNTNIIQQGLRGADIGYNTFLNAVFFDMNAFCPDAQHNARIDAWDRKDLIYPTNGRKLTLPTDICPLRWEVHCSWADINKSFTLTSTAGEDKKWNISTVDAGGAGYRWVSQQKTSWTQQASYDDSKINDILCGSVSSSTDTDLYVPVLYDGKINITNINEAKTDIQPAKVRCHTLHGQSNTKDSVNQYIHHVIDPGYVIEPESNVTTGGHVLGTWEDASLIKASRCYYNEVWPASRTSVECELTAGIPLCEIEKNTDTLTIKFTPNWTTFIGDTGKRIMFSKEPITETTFDPNTSANKDKYLNIRNATTGGVDTKYIVLNNGVMNDIYIDNLDEGDKIYYKITWETGVSNNDTNYTKIVTISEPECLALVDG